MRIKSLYIKKYKILENLFIDFKESTNVNVIIGKNGAGKTTLFEAIIHIFRELSLASSNGSLKSRFKVLKFEFEIQYSCKGSEMIFHSQINDKGVHEQFFKVNHNFFSLSKENLRTPIEKEQDFTSKPIFKYLPDHIITYYSGESNRITSLFEEHQTTASKTLQKGKNIPFREFINIDTDSIRKVLLSLLPFTDFKAKASIGKVLSLDSIISVQIYFKQPKWYNTAETNFNKLENENSEDALERFNQEFYYAEGEVGQFLDKLTKFSKKTYDPSTNFISSLEIRPDDIIDYFSFEKQDSLSNSLDFYKMLDHTHHSDLIQSIILDIKLDDSDSTTEFNNMSEGEHQIKLVLGLGEIFKSKETLFLFDEPDTYLHPQWQRNLMDFLNSCKANFIMSTHSPQVLGKVHSNSIFVIDKGKTHPIDSPTINRDTNSILEEIFDVTQRPKEVESAITVIFDLLSQNKLEQAKKQIVELKEKLDSQDPVFLKISASIKRKQLLGK